MSGLGLEAQQKAVNDFLNGGHWQMIGEFTEIETGKRADRPQLAAALELCKREGAKLIVAKLDRLARNVHFVSGLMESGVDFVAVDMPTANRLTVHILAAVAEHERACIAERTRAALAAAKARGVKLGNPAIAAHNHDAAIRRADDLRSVIAELRRAGVRSVRAIAAELNARDIPTPRGGTWHANTVNLLLHRIDATRPKDAGRTRRARRRARPTPRRNAPAPAR